MQQLGQRQLESILTELSDGFFLISENFEILDIDKRYSGYGGVPIELILGAKVFDVFPQIQGSIYETTARRVMKTGVPERFEARSVVYPDRWYEVHVISDRSRAILVYRDITARRAAEETLERNKAELVRSEERIRTVVSTAPCILWEAEVILVPEKKGYRWGRLCIADEAAAQQVMPLEIPEGGSYAHVWLESRDRGDALQAEALARRAFLLDEPMFVCEFRCQDRFERTHWQRQHVAIRRVRDGVLSLTGLAIDITERKLADQQLTRLISEAPCIFWEAEITGLAGWQEPYTGGNYPFEWQVRIQDEHAANAVLPLEVLPGESFSEVWCAHRLPGEAEKIHAVSVRALQRNESACTFEYRCLDRHGQVHWIFEQISFQRRSFGRWHAAGVAMDVTQQKRAEDELRRAKDDAEHANKAKDRFLATLSHELRTPLNPVLLGVHTWIQDETLPEQLREDLLMIQRNVELEARMIDDLLDLTSISRGKLRLNFREVDVHNVIHYVEDIVCSDARQKNLRVVLQLEAKECVVQTDSGRLEQVLWNLVKNAVKFTPPGGEITILTRDFEGQLQVEVVDTGVGIPPELLPGIFEAFEQGDPRIRDVYGGLGLGLAIAKGIIELLGGTIHAASRRDGTGSRFTVTLPRLPA